MKHAWIGWMLALTVAGSAAAGPVLRVEYAGSMGTVMDLGLGPAFAKVHRVGYQGIGAGSYALARLLAARQQRADVFIAITPGPMAVLQHAGLIVQVVPIASTQMVVIYSPKSRFASDFRAAATGRRTWYDVLREPGMRFGRTDPAIDPQGANVLLTLQLASIYYHQPHLLDEVTGGMHDTRGIFTEPSILSRLQAGQIDATIGYASAARSHRLPTVALPHEINLGDPSMQSTWYARAGYALPDGKRRTVQPPVFYAAVLKNAPHPALARAYVEFLLGPDGQRILRRHGYGEPSGASP